MKMVRVAWAGLFWAAGTAAMAAPLKIFTTTTDLADLARQVGGDQAQVESLSQGFQDPHFVEAKPSLIAKLMKADVFIQNGLELEVGWAPLLLQGARNPRIREGGTGFVDASRFVTPLEVPSNPTRAAGDVHPGGNPHYLADPENGRRVARGLAAAFTALRPDGAAAFQSRLAAFEKKLDEGIKTWTAALAPSRGATFVSYHRNMVYFAQRFGLVSVAEIEPKPGIPPTAAHTAAVEAAMAARGTRLIFTQPYFERRTVDAIACDTGARVVVFCLSPGGAPAAVDYLSTLDANVQAIVAARGGQ